WCPTLPWCARWTPVRGVSSIPALPSPRVWYRQQTRSASEWLGRWRASPEWIYRVTAQKDFYIIPTRNASVAQLDRVGGFEPLGREFESLRVRHTKNAPLLERGIFIYTLPLPILRANPHLFWLLSRSADGSIVGQNSSSLARSLCPVRTNPKQLWNSKAHPLPSLRC